MKITDKSSIKTERSLIRVNNQNIVVGLEFKILTMGKGDIKTKKGKISNNSFGKTRPRDVKKVVKATESAEEKSTK